MAAATLFGPVAAGALIERHGWGTMTAAMGVFAFSGAVSSVSLLSTHQNSRESNHLSAACSSCIQVDGSSRKR